MVAMAAAGSSLLRERISSKWLARIAAQG
jgi:hypothetical protein